MRAQHGVEHGAEAKLASWARRRANRPCCGAGAGLASHARRAASRRPDKPHRMKGKIAATRWPSVASSGRGYAPSAGRHRWPARQLDASCRLSCRQIYADSGRHRQHLTLALETGYQASEKPVGEAIVNSVLSKQIDDLEPTLTRHGYTARVLTEMLGTKPGEIKALFKPDAGGRPRARTEGADARRRTAGLTQGPKTGRFPARPGPALSCNQCGHDPDDCDLSCSLYAPSCSDCGSDPSGPVQ